MLAAGLIDRERRGRNLYYRINQSVIEEALGVVLELLSFDASTVPGKLVEQS